MCKINSLENEVLFAFLLHHLITLKRITVHFSNSKKKKKSISEVQADFILIYYNNKRTIISFLEALSLYHLNSRQGFVVHQSTGLCRAGLQAQPRAGKG